MKFVNAVVAFSFAVITWYFIEDPFMKRRSRSLPEALIDFCGRK